jgi:hypothetical protein
MTMGKDREGKFHPQKGKPSGSGKEEGIGLNPAHTERIKEYLDISERYTTDGTEAEANVKTRHPNRNVDKTVDHSENKNPNKVRKKDKLQAEPEEERIPVSWNELTKELFSEVSEFKSDLAISIYLPTHPSGVEVNEQIDIINFKNELQFIEDELQRKGTSTTAIQKILKPAKELLLIETFWRDQSLGFAAFLSAGYFKFVKIPYTPSRETIINSAFVLSQLVSWFTNTDYFFLLVLSKKQARFYKVNSFNIFYIPIEALPNGIVDVVHLEEKDDQNLFRTGSSGAGGGANFHGVGAGKPDEKENIAMYLHEVDETLWKEILHTEHVPLLLAAVDYLIPIYKQVSKYNNIYEESLTGSYEHESLQSLFEKSKEKLRPYFEQRAKNALENYLNRSATNLISSEPSEIIPAAHYGRIASLFVQPNEHLWGHFDEAENKLTVNNNPQVGDDLLSKSIIKTILTGGEVFFLDEKDMPNGNKMAALMRY